MHNAPSVNYPVGRSRFAGALAAVAWLLGGLALAGWALQAAGPGWRHALGLAAWLAGGLLAGLAWWRSPAGELAWDGGQWSWAGGAVAAPPRVVLDLQHRLLLQLANAQWLWLERDRDPPNWDALRRAVYSRASTATPQGAQPPVTPT